MHLWALDTPRTGDLTLDNLNSSQAALAGGLLELIQLLAGRASGDPPRAMAGNEWGARSLPEAGCGCGGAGAALGRGP